MTLAAATTDSFGYADPTDWIRSPVDVPAAKRAVNAARRALIAEDIEPTPAQIVFTLLVEAAQTEGAIAKPGPRGSVSCMPEVYQTRGEIFATEVSMIADKISYPPVIKPAVSAAAASRYIEVTKWLRFVEGKNRKKSKELLWLMARNAPGGYIARVTGYHTPSAQRGAKHRRLAEIVKRLNVEKIFD